MKRILLFAAATAVALSSCSKNEVTTSNLDGQAINFSTYTGVAGRATVETGFEVGDVMTVQAYETGTDNFSADATATKFMENTVTNDPYLGWTYSPLKYWYKDGKQITFFGLTSATDVAPVFNAIGDDNVVSFDFTNGAISGDQTDIMGAVLRDKSINNKTDMQFKYQHLLSQLKFNISTSLTAANDPAIKVTTVDFDFADTFAYAGKYNFSADAAVATLGDWKADTTAPQGDTSVITDVTVGENAVALMDPILLIPQATTETSLKVTLTYTMTYGDGSVVTDKASFVVNPTDGLAQNTIYIYNISIGLEAIIFGTPTIEDWGDSVNL